MKSGTVLTLTTVYFVSKVHVHMYMYTVLWMWVYVLSLYMYFECGFMYYHCTCTYIDYSVHVLYEWSTLYFECVWCMYTLYCTLTSKYGYIVCCLHLFRIQLIQVKYCQSIVMIWYMVKDTNFGLTNRFLPYFTRMLWLVITIIMKLNLQKRDLVSKNNVQVYLC